MQSAANGPGSEPRKDVADEPVAVAKGENPALKFVIDMLPLAVFFGGYRLLGLKSATALLIGVTLVSLIAARVLLGKISPMLIVTAVLVCVFGGLTLALDDPRFIYVKPTAINLLFAGALGYGLATGKPLLKMLLGEAMHLTDRGWRLLTLRWIGLFLGLAALNEVIWRTYTGASAAPRVAGTAASSVADTVSAAVATGVVFAVDREYIWVNFKVFGILAITTVFAALQLPLLRRHAAAAESES